MDKTDESDWRKRLLPGQFTMTGALTKALEVANEAYTHEAWKEDWSEEDWRALKVPEKKVRGIR